MPRLTYEAIRRMTPEALSKLSKEQTKDLLIQFRKKYQVRSEQLERWSDRVFSYAKDKMDTFYEDSPTTNIDKMSRNQMQNEIFQIQSFFQSKTSSVSGSKEVAREQDKRIFGETATGRPKHTLDVDTRKKFWKLYDEYTNQNPIAETAFKSGKIQQYLGNIAKSESLLNSMIIDEGGGKYTFDTGKLQLVTEGLKSYDKTGEFKANVFTGRGNTTNL